VLIARTKADAAVSITDPKKHIIIEEMEGNMTAEKQEQVVRQATLTLQHFNCEVPVLYLEDGTPYLPVVALCGMLGLRAAAHIPRSRRLVLWANARKLPLQTARGQRIVWCLHMGALPFWCACFNWSLVPAERRGQLHQATDAWLNNLAQAQRVLLGRYRSLRSDLFAFLEAYSDAEIWLDQWAQHLSATLDATASRQFEALLSQGKTLIDEATAQAREMVLEQAMAPILDIITIDENGAVTETDTQPLFPAVPGEDREQFFASVRKLAQWHREIAACISHLKPAQNGE
jgi:hypothetical protein